MPSYQYKSSFLHCQKAPVPYFTSHYYLLHYTISYYHHRTDIMAVLTIIFCIDFSDRGDREGAPSPEPIRRSPPADRPSR